MLHADYSRHLANEGVTPTLIFAGAHKVDANPFEPLGDAVRADLQQEVESFYVAFLETVAKGRGQRLTAEAARATEARTFIGARAVEVGLADRVGTFESVLADLSRASTRTTVPKRSVSMGDNNGVPAAESAGVSKADHDVAVAAARSEGEAAGVKAATERLNAVLGADGIKGDGKRMSAALDLAVSSPAMAADAVVTFVTGNVAASAPTAAQQVAETDARRLAAAALAQPDAAAGRKPSGLSAGISAHAERVKRSA
jgi:ClpP class serine protease